MYTIAFATVLSLFGMIVCIIGLCKYCKIGTVALAVLIAIIVIAHAGQHAGTSVLVPTDMPVHSLRQYFPEDACEPPVGDPNDFAIIKEHE